MVLMCDQDICSFFDLGEPFALYCRLWSRLRLISNHFPCCCLNFHSSVVPNHLQISLIVAFSSHSHSKSFQTPKSSNSLHVCPPFFTSFMPFKLYRFLYSSLIIRCFQHIYNYTPILLLKCFSIAPDTVGFKK